MTPKACSGILTNPSISTSEETIQLVQSLTTFSDDCSAQHYWLLAGTTFSSIQAFWLIKLMVLLYFSKILWCTKQRALTMRAHLLKYRYCRTVLNRFHVSFFSSVLINEQQKTKSHCLNSVLLLTCSLNQISWLTCTRIVSAWRFAHRKNLEKYSTSHYTVAELIKSESSSGKVSIMYISPCKKDSQYAENGSHSQTAATTNSRLDHSAVVNSLIHV